MHIILTMKGRSDTAMFERTKNAPSINWLRFVLVSCFILVIFPWGSTFYKKPFIEDAWYGLSIARNIADGLGVTIDGNQITNGFQPLQVFIDSLFFYFTNSDLVALSLSFSFRLLLHISSAYVFSFVIKSINKSMVRRSFHDFVFAIYLFNPAIVTCAINGLETGLLLFLFLIFVLAIIKEDFKNFTFRSQLKVTICSVALIYTRLDMVVIISCVLIWCFFFRDKAISFRILFATYLAIFPWLLWNYIYFGSIVPISGQQQLLFDFSLLRIAHFIKAVTYNMSPWLGSTYNQGSLFLEIIYFLIRIVFLIWLVSSLCLKCNIRKFNLNSGDSFGVIIAMILGSTLLSGYYTLFTISTYFYQRYTILFAPLALILILKRVEGGVTRAQSMAVWTALIISLLNYFTIYQSPRSENSLFDNQVRLVLRSVPDNQIVGARQSGTLGYFRKLVVNLDGKVNPKAPKKAPEMSNYLKLNGINWLCDWPSELTKIVSGHEVDWQVLSKNSSVVCLKRK